MERNKNFDAGCYKMPTIRSSKQAASDIATIVFWAILMCWCLSGLTGCTTGGGRFYCGYEEQNHMKNISGYDVPDKYKK